MAPSKRVAEESFIKMVICKRVGRVKSSSKEEMIKHTRRRNGEKPSLGLKGQRHGSHSPNSGRPNAVERMVQQELYALYTNGALANLRPWREDDRGINTLTFLSSYALMSY